MSARRTKKVGRGPSLIGRVRRVFELLAAREEVGLPKRELGRSQLRQLAEVASTPGLSAAELARRVGLAPQSVGTSVLLLESRGLLRRVPHPVHRRLVELSVTAAGKRLLARAQRSLARVEAGAVSRLPAAKQKSLAKLLEDWEAALARRGGPLTRVRSKPGAAPGGRRVRRPARG